MQPAYELENQTPPSDMSDAKLTVALAEYRRLATEIDSNIAGMRAWLRLAVSASATHIAGILVVLRHLPEATPLLPATMSGLLVFFAIHFTRDDIKRVRVVKYYREYLEPLVRELAGGDIRLLGWHDFSAFEAGLLKSESESSARYLGRFVTVTYAMGTSVAFWLGGVASLTRADMRPTDDLAICLLAALYVCVFYSFIRALNFFWKESKTDAVRGG